MTQSREPPLVSLNFLFLLPRAFILTLARAASLRRYTGIRDVRSLPSNEVAVSGRCSLSVCPALSSWPRLDSEREEDFTGHVARMMCTWNFAISLGWRCALAATERAVLPLFAFANAISVGISALLYSSDSGKYFFGNSARAYPSNFTDSVSLLSAFALSITYGR